MTTPENPIGLPAWPVRLADVGARGRHVVRDRLDEAAAAGLAHHLGVEAVTAFRLDVEVEPYRGDGLKVAGTVNADIRQICVVSLEPIETRISEPIAASFRPAEAIKPHLIDDDEGPAIDASVDVDDPLNGDGIDLAALAAEFLLLAIDPYPRRPDAIVEIDDDTAATGPFSVLAERLKGRA